MTLSLPRRVARTFALVLAVGACAVTADVEAERSDQIDAGSVEQPPVTGPGAVSSLTWGGCERYDIPPVEFLGTERWECASLVVPMNQFGDSSGLDDVVLALTRHPATGERRGELLMNPGGPGASGLELAWGLRGLLPADMLRSFDIISWDPRGVGASVPPITCGADPDIDDEFLMSACAAATGDLAAHLAAPYSAADMESIRAALGASRLNYLGYSYGAALGASYASQFPGRVGRFVLDGVTDPLIGSADGYFENGFPYYASDGLDAASARFEELCDRTARCDLGADSATTLIGLTDAVGALPTADFEFDPQVITSDLFTELHQSAMSFAGDWELYGTALADADRGDASALAALTSVEQGISSDALGAPSTAFELSNLVIYCADFARVIRGWGYCDALPRNEFPIEPVVAVDVDEPMLVIGTEYDPMTPGVHAPAFAAALGDAVHIIWEGVGHTAFPAPTSCVNDTVADYLLIGALPADGKRCAFLDGVADDDELADELFGHGGLESERLLIDALRLRGGDASTVRCVAREVNQLDDRVISHTVLGVGSADAEAALSLASAKC